MKRVASYVYDQHFRARLIKLWTEGLPTKDIALRLGVSKNTVVGRARRLAEEGALKPRVNPVMPKRVETVSHETEEIEEDPVLVAEIKAEIEQQIEAATAPRPTTLGKALPENAFVMPPLPPVTRHSRSVLRQMGEMQAIDLPLTALRPDGTLFFFLAPSKVEPFIQPPEPRKGCPWIVSEPGAGDKRRWQGATFCGQRVADGATYCPRHQAIASTTPAFRRNLVVN